MSLRLNRLLQDDVGSFDRRDLSDDKPLIYAEPVGNDEDLKDWCGVIEGPRGSPYEHRCFRIAIRIPNDYPRSPPLVRFITNIKHPNIYVGDDQFFGKVC